MNRAIVAGGHLTDGPERAEERFPSSSVPKVQSLIRKIFDAWQVGAGDTLLCGGARGGDLLFAEEALKRGAKVQLVLASNQPDFIEQSVSLPESDWTDRFNGVSGHKNCGSEILPGDWGNERYVKVNDLLLHRSREAGREVLGALVWDGKAGLPGGTGDMAKLLKERNVRYEVVRPKP